MAVLVLVNLVLVAFVALAVWRWTAARAAVAPLADSPAVVIRATGLGEDTVERCLHRALRASSLVQVGEAEPGWSAPPPGVVRVAGPAVGDRAVVLEVAGAHLEDLLAGLVTVLLEEGWEVSQTKGRKVTLRRKGLRATLAVSPV